MLQVAPSIFVFFLVYPWPQSFKKVKLTYSTLHSFCNMIVGFEGLVRGYDNKLYYQRRYDMQY